MGKFDVIEKAMCNEHDTISRKLDGGSEMSVTDVDRIDTLVHALKSLATYKAMKEAEEYEGFSGANMRDAGRSGEYASRSYSDGYNQGYHDARYRGGHTW